jgi:HEAT repeat protein
VQDSLETLIHGFDEAPIPSSRRMRRLLEEDRDAFLRAAVVSLRQVGETRGYYYLIKLLADHGLLRKLVSDPTLNLSAALTLARVGMQIDPTLFSAMARTLLNGLGEQNIRRAEEAIRILDILATIPNFPRLAPLLEHLLQHPDPRMRSKAALLIGRRNKSANWVEQSKQEPDPRVRANALEGLWGADEDAVRRLFWEMAWDANNRVVGNALMGLYLIGDTRAIARTLEVAGNVEPRFRATAAWVMGQSGDPRFRTALGRMLVDRDRMVRGRAFRSLSTIRRRVAAMSRSGCLQVHLWDARRVSATERQVRAAVVDMGGTAVMPALDVKQFIVTEGSHVLTAYELHKRPAPVSLTIGFGLPFRNESGPALYEQTLLECLRGKPPSHLWAVMHYGGEFRTSRGDDEEIDPARFTAKTEDLVSLTEKPLASSTPTGGLMDAARQLLAGAASLSGERHLVLIGSSPALMRSEDEANVIAGNARDAGVVIHGLAVADGDAEILQVLCRATGGRLLRAADDREIAAALRRICWGLQYQDEIHYHLEQSPGPHALVHVQVWSELGIAEDSLTLE